MRWWRKKWHDVCCICSHAVESEKSSWYLGGENWSSICSDNRQSHLHLFNCYWMVSSYLDGYSFLDNGYRWCPVFSSDSHLLIQKTNVTGIKHDCSYKTIFPFDQHSGMQFPLKCRKRYQNYTEVHIISMFPDLFSNSISFNDYWWSHIWSSAEGS